MTKIDEDEAYRRGFWRGLEWEGPDRDGQLGSLSEDFIAETEDGPTDACFWQGFDEGRDDPQSYLRRWRRGETKIAGQLGQPAGQFGERTYTCRVSYREPDGFEATKTWCRYAYDPAHATQDAESWAQTMRNIGNEVTRIEVIRED